MSKLESIVSLEYHKNQYTVASIIRAGVKIPILLNRDVYKVIRKLDKKWYVNDKNHIYCLVIQNDTEIPVYLHELVIKLSNKTNSFSNKSTIHVNNIHFDNRIENLQLDDENKDYQKSTKKKNRIINLTRHGVDVNTLPTYIWYIKPDKTHGDRFAVEIPNKISWRTTASKKLSLRYKLEEAKKYLRYMKDTYPDMFDDHSMNGDLTRQGFNLYKEYQMMIGKAGFSINDPPINNTDLFLKKDTSDLTDFEVFLLYSFDPRKGVDINDTLNDYLELFNQSQ